MEHILTHHTTVECFSGMVDWDRSTAGLLGQHHLSLAHLPRAMPATGTEDRQDQRRNKYTNFDRALHHTVGVAEPKMKYLGRKCIPFRSRSWRRLWVASASRCCRLYPCRWTEGQHYKDAMRRMRPLSHQERADECPKGRQAPHKAATYAVLLAHPHSHEMAIPAGSVASVPVQFPNIRGDLLIEGGAPTSDAEFEVPPAVQRYRRGENC
jgi:hypothetical protein